MSTIKAVMEGTGETCEFFVNNDSTIEQLVASLASLLGVDQTFKIKYKDTEGDSITMSTTEELREVIRTSPTLKLEVCNARKTVRPSDYALRLSEPAMAATKVVMSRAGESSASVGVQAKAETASTATASASLTPTSFDVQRLLVHNSILLTYLGVQAPALIEQPSSPEEELSTLVRDAADFYAHLLATVHVESHATSQLAKHVAASLAKYGTHLSQDFVTTLDSALGSVVSSASRTATDDSEHQFRFNETESTVLINPEVRFVEKEATPEPAQPHQPQEQRDSQTNARLEVDVHADDFIIVSGSGDDVHQPSQPQQEVSNPPVDAAVVSEFDPLAPPPPRPPPHRCLPLCSGGRCPAGPADD